MSPYKLRGVAIACLLHDDARYLVASLDKLREYGPVYAFVSRTPWAGHLGGDWQSAAEECRQAGAEVITGDWSARHECMKAARAWVIEHGFREVFLAGVNLDLDLGILSMMVGSTPERPVITNYSYVPSGDLNSITYPTGYVERAPQLGY